MYISIYSLEKEFSILKIQRMKFMEYSYKKKDIEYN